MRRTKRRKSQKRTFKNSGTPVRRTKRRKHQKWTFRNSGTLCAEQYVIARSVILGLLCAEQEVGNLKKCTFSNYGTPVGRTRRRKSQKQMHCQEFWDSCAQNKTSEISKNALSGILGHLFAEQTSEISKTVLSGILRLLCAEQDVGNLKKWTFRNAGTPMRRT